MSLRLMPLRTWLPQEYMDEVTPPPRSTPADWIVRSHDGTPVLAVDPFLGSDTPGEPHRLAEGDVVPFAWHEDYGVRTLTFRHPPGEGWHGDLSGTEPTASEGGTLTVCEWGSVDSLAYSLPALIQAYTQENGHPVEDGDELLVHFFAWSTKPVPFTFMAGAFVPGDTPPDPPDAPEA